MDMSKVMKYIEENKAEYYEKLLADEEEQLKQAEKENKMISQSCFMKLGAILRQPLFGHASNKRTSYWLFDRSNPRRM